MLTESEHEWLEDREYARYHYSCQWCLHYDPILIMPDRQNVPCMQYTTCSYHTNNYDYKDALEFSERVAMKLVKHIHDKPLICETTWDCPYWPQGKCAWCYLKAARLEVEEEMGV